MIISSDIPPQPPMIHEATKSAWTRAVSINPTTIAVYLHTDGRLLLHIRHITSQRLIAYPCTPAPKYVIKSREDFKYVYDLLFNVTPSDKVFWMGEDITQNLKGDLAKLREFTTNRSWE